MGSTWLALLCFLAIGGAASGWIYGVRLRREEAQAGIMTFAGMHWREFQRLIVAALERRGCRRRVHGELPEDDGNVDLECDGKPWLLSTKHGAGYVLSAHAINEFASAMKLRGTDGGWMTTLGEVSGDNRDLARRHGIELLDGRTLWNEIRPLLDAEQITAIAGASRKRASRQLAVAWGVAAIVGLLVFVTGRGEPGVPDATDATPVQAPAATAASAPADQRDTAAGDVGPTPAPTDTAALAARRKQLVDTVGTLPWVDRAAWSSHSTLTVYLAGDAQGDKDALCGIVARYDELASSRMQLQPPSGSGTAVRFMQCRSY